MSLPWPAPDTSAAQIAGRWAEDPQGIAAEGLLRCADIAFAAGMLPLTMELLAAHLGVVPDDAAQSLRLATLRLQQGDDRGAEAALRDLLRYSPAQADAWAILRSILSQRGDIAATLAALREQQAAMGDTPALAFEEARLLLSQRQSRAAEAALARIPPGAREHLDAARLLPQLALERFALDAAVSAAEAGLRQHPGDVLLSISLAQALFRQARFNEALVPLDAALGVEPANAPLLRMRSEIALRQARLTAAFADALAAAELDPGNADNHYHAGMLAQRLGYSDQALRLLQAALELQPGNTEIALAIARLHAASGRHDAALAALDEAAQIAPGDAGLQALRLSVLQQADAARSAGPLRPLRPLPRSRDARDGGLAQALHIQARVLAALVRREIHHLSRFSRFGLAAVVLEPLAHVAVLGLVMFFFNHGRPPLGNDLFFFYATGILPFLLFSHIAEHALHAYRDNAGVFQVSLVRRPDTVVAIGLTHTLVDGIACVVILTVLVMIGSAAGVHDWRVATAAFLATGLLGLGFGMVGAALNSANQGFQTLWYSGQRILYVLSGLFYLPMHMPATAREWLVWNLMLGCIEWFRSGVFAQYQPPWVSPGYVLGCAFGLLLLGLFLERPFRRLARA